MRHRRFILETFAIFGVLLVLTFAGNTLAQQHFLAVYLPMVFGERDALPTATATQIPFTPTRTPVPILVNGDFESGSVGWDVEDGAFINLHPELAHSGSYFAQLSGFDRGTPSIRQRVYIEPDKPYLVYWDIALSNWTSCGHDAGYVWIDGEAAAVNQSFCDGSEYGTYRRHSTDLSRFAGKTVDMKFEMRLSSNVFSAWNIDDVSFSSSF